MKDVIEIAKVITEALRTEPALLSIVIVVAMFLYFTRRERNHFPHIHQRFDSLEKRFDRLAELFINHIERGQ